MVPTSDRALRAAALIAVGALGACASPADPAKMVPAASAISAFSADSSFRNAIVIDSVGGGEETNPALVSRVDSGALREALRLALQQRMLLASSPEQAPWRLKVFLVELKYPGSTFTTTVGSFVRYTLTRSADRTTVFDEIIAAPFTVTVGEVYLGIERLKVANEGAIRANIAAFLEQLRRLDMQMQRTELSRGRNGRHETTIN